MNRERWKRIGLALLYPPLWLMIVLTPIAGGATVAMFVYNLSEHPIAVAAYVPAAYCLTAWTAFCICRLPGYLHAAKARVNAHPVGHRYLTNVVFKTRVSLYTSLIFNLFYVCFKVGMGIFYQTAWFYIFAAYYAIMAVMRFLLLRYELRHTLGADPVAESKRVRLCAIVLLSVNVILSGAVLMMTTVGRGFTYPGMLIYVMAAYTFYNTIMAIVNAVRYRKYQSPVLSMAKVIGVASALFSMLALESAMFAEFGSNEGPEFERTMIMATGAGIAIIVVVLSARMIVHTTRALQIIKHNYGESYVK